MTGNTELHKAIYSRTHQKDANGMQTQKLSSSKKHTEILEVNPCIYFQLPNGLEVWATAWDLKLQKRNLLK